MFWITCLIEIGMCKNYDTILSRARALRGGVQPATLRYRYRLRLIPVSTTRLAVEYRVRVAERF